MDCRTVKDRLFREEDEVPLRAHMESCASCAAFASRLTAAREVLRAPVSQLEPDPGFALRVRARLPRPAEVLGWAALRALPAALAVAAALAWAGLSQPPSLASLLTSEPTAEMLLTYGAFTAEEGR